MSNKNQLHILIGCADARDLNQLQVDTVNSKISEYLERGIRVQVQVIRAAGSFVSKDVYQDLKHIILNYQKEIPADISEEGYFVHIQSHGDLTEDSNTDYVSHIYEMRVKDGSPLNCGMLHASGLGIEIEQLILARQLTYKYNGVEKMVSGDADIRTLLRDVYAHDGFLAGDWVKSIDLLRTHPRLQKTNLEHLIEHDPDLKRLNLKVTAGILDYSIHGLIRLDGGEPQVPFWDEVQQEIRRKSADNLDVLKRQGEKQKPDAGLICMADPRATSRLTAAKYFYRFKGMNEPKGYLANSVFNLTGSTFDIPSIPFGPYAITGFYYSVKHLHLRDYLVMGYDQAQTDRILMKIKCDPIMNLIANTFDVNLIALNQQDIA
ncbi:MAG: hypothetical protein SH856_04920 [Flavobacteriales bacterium]|nr:hypothetical protein [Flavobacteriales bacterium]